MEVSMSVIIVGPLLFLAWGAVSTLIFWLLPRRMAARSESVPVHIAIAFLCAFVLAPGFVYGHGAIPFPGGAAYVLMSGGSLQGAIDPVNLLNAFSWLVTGGTFAAVSWRYRERARIKETL
jgi:hypothetical protein